MLKLKSSLFLLIGLILTISAIAYLAINPSSPAQNLSQIFRRQLPQKLIPTPTPISKPVQVEVTTVRGTIAAFNKSLLSLKVGSTTKNYSIVKTFDIQKLVSGTVEGGDAKTVPAKFEDLQKGQEVLLIVEKTSNHVRSIYILR